MNLCVILLGGVALFGALVLADDEVRGERERRSSYPQQQQQIQPQQPVATYQQQQPQQVQPHQQQTHQKQENSHKTKKRCYQCAYSPPKTIHSRKTVHVGQQGHAGQGYGQQQQEQYVSQTLHGGWDKCLGPFDHYQAKAYGVDTWDCHSGNCYVRRDPNGDVFRGCFKGEYGVDQHQYGCHYQSGSTYCFCEGELCNNSAAPQGQQH